MDAQVAGNKEARHLGPLEKIFFSIPRAPIFILFENTSRSGRILPVAEGRHNPGYHMDINPLPIASLSAVGFFR